MEGAVDGVSILLKYTLESSIEAEALKIILKNLNMEVYLLEKEKIDPKTSGLIKWKMSDQAAFAQASLKAMLNDSMGGTDTRIDNSLLTMLEITL
ncbi:hypothetical protein JYU12_00715 [bacterium AH-315-K03]|nr:hypothetical protein [bacterium AH-315-K03]